MPEKILAWQTFPPSFLPPALFNRSAEGCKLAAMAEKTTEVKVRAHSPGRHPILILELPSGELRAAYHETAYDLKRTKPVEERWLYENAIGRHSFVEVKPPRELPAGELLDYVRRELLAPGGG
jgi:hypothetical protein